MNPIDRLSDAFGRFSSLSLLLPSQEKKIKLLMPLSGEFARRTNVTQSMHARQNTVETIIAYANLQPSADGTIKPEIFTPAMIQVTNLLIRYNGITADARPNFCLFAQSGLREHNKRITAAPTKIPASTQPAAALPEAIPA